MSDTLAPLNLTPGPARLRLGRPREATIHLRELGEFLRACGREALRPLGALGWRAVVAGVYMAAVVGDILTTQWGMSSGVSEEANTVAAAGMAVVGTTGYVILASLAGAMLVLALAARPRSRIGWAVQLGVLLVVAVKCQVVVQNTVLLA